MFTRKVFLSCVVLCVTAASVFAAGQSKVTTAADSDWRYYSGDNGSTKYSPLDQINRNNVSQLKVAWRRPFLSAEFRAANPDIKPSNNFRATPIKVGGVVYASTGVGLAQAFDPVTGRTIWEQRTPPEGVRNGIVPRGIAYWQEGSEARVFTYTNNFLYALNPKTGEPVAGFGKDGKVDLNDGHWGYDLALDVGSSGRSRCRRHGLYVGRTGLRVEEGGRARRRSRV